MAKERLSDSYIKNAKGAGHGPKGRKYHSDGSGLNLKVTTTGSKSWVFRWWDKSKAKPGERGKLREMGLGSYPDIGLAKARKMAAPALEIANAGGDPIKAREIVEHDAKAEVLEAVNQPAPGVTTFDKAAEEYVANKIEPESRSTKHVNESRAKLATYASPIFGDLPIDEVELSHVRSALEPIWQTKNPSAVKLRGLIEQVIDYSTVMGYRSGENPARWRGNLKHVLASPNKVTGVRHLPSLHYDHAADFMRLLSKRGGHRARCLEFNIYTAVRSGESRGARWDEIDLAKKIWTLPSERMKSGREHRIPLTSQAIKILKGQKGLHDEFVFPGARGNSCLSNMAMTMLLRDMKRPDISVHGFRSTFRTWAAETTGHPHDICEAALSHVTGDKTVQAYQHSDLLKKRAKLMTDWANFLTTN